MNDKPKKSEKKLINPSIEEKKIDGVEVSLEELESLCYSFDRRPRGCGTGTFASVGDSDDVLF